MYIGYNALKQDYTHPPPLFCLSQYKWLYWFCSSEILHFLQTTHRSFSCCCLLLRGYFFSFPVCEQYSQSSNTSESSDIRRTKALKYNPILMSVFSLKKLSCVSVCMVYSQEMSQRGQSPHLWEHLLYGTLSPSAPLLGSHITQQTRYCLKSTSPSCSTTQC